MYAINFPAQTRKASFTTICELKDQMTGELIDLSDDTLVFKIMDRGCVRVEATAENGMLALIDGYDGYFEIDIPDLECLCAGTYACHLTITREDITRDLFVGNLPIVEA